MVIHTVSSDISVPKKRIPSMLDFGNFVFRQLQRQPIPLKSSHFRAFFTRELREFFNYATPLVIMLSLYMFQFTMLFTS